MKRLVGWMVIVAVLALGVFTFSGQACAGDETKVVGVVEKIDLAKDGKSAVIKLKDNKTGSVVDVVVTDELTLDKFKDKRIVEGDEVRCKYELTGGKNQSKLFRKTAGC